MPAFCLFPDAKFLPDFFLDDSAGIEAFTAPSPAIPRSGSRAASAAPTGDAEKSTGSSQSSSASEITDPDLAKTFSAIQGLINPDLLKSINAVFVFELKGQIRSRQKCRTLQFALLLGQF